MTNETIAASPRLATTSIVVAATNRMGVATSGLFAQWLRGLTINAHERLALAHLWEHGPMTMSELGSRIPLSRAAVTALTDRLEALRYVQRTPDAHDRRRTVLSLTERPEQLIQDMVATWMTDVSALEQRFDATELRAIERWNEGLREISHRHAALLRARRDDELPSGDLG
ncbi:MAG: transcriptional regulator, MarR family [Thermoleophilia bacterium]|nr:transcriptional regulator, MarR family [Thermoleophilia bacterium]